ncbi:hypothetical protein BGW80DRAFT_149596 [Lactifluus volemus]|nr:hypothetical protein BGW80DRAFT_149596 [Lactifluus volemus]
MLTRPIVLKISDPFNRMFEVPSMITMSIAATRMHLSLVDYNASNSTTEIAQRSDRAASKTKGIPTLSTPLDRMQVSITREYEQYPPSETGHNSSQVGRDEYLGNGVSLGDDLESGER